MGQGQLDREPRVMAALIGTTVLLAVVGLTISALTAPVERLLGESAHAIPSAIHGFMAGLFFVTVTIGLFEGVRVFLGASIPPGELQFGSLVNAILALLTVLYGNIIYIPYRAKSGPRSYFLETIPEVHKIFFEFKEFMALFTLSLAVCVAYLIWVYRDQITRHAAWRVMTALLLALLFFYFMVTFGLGASITKLKAV